MSDSDNPKHRRRKHIDRDDEQDLDRRRNDTPRDRDRDRKRHRSRSRSVSTDRGHDKHKRRRSSPIHERRSERSEHDRGHDGRRSNRRDDYHKTGASKDADSDDERQRYRQRRQHRSRSRSRDNDFRRESRDDVKGNSTHHRQRRRSKSRSYSPANDHRKALTGSHRDSERRSSRERPSRHRRRSYSSSPPPTSKSGSGSNAVSRRARGPLPSQQEAFTSKDGSRAVQGAANGEKQKPNYKASGKLAAETNTVSIGGEAIVLKYHEPPEARKPPSAQAWRMYEFKGENQEPLSTTELGMRSCWLFGRETAVVDFLIEHPSCSKQHAVIQFRYIEKRSEFGDKIGAVKPYLLDLESANGTLVNGEKVPDRRYIELKSGDSVGFGESTRDYVILLPPREKVVTE